MSNNGWEDDQELTLDDEEELTPVLDDEEELTLDDEEELTPVLETTTPVDIPSVDWEPVLEDEDELEYMESEDDSYINSQDVGNIFNIGSAVEDFEYDDSDGLYLEDELEYQEDEIVIEEKDEETLKTEKLAVALDARKTNHRRYRNRSGSKLKTLNYLSDTHINLEGAYEGYFAKLGTTTSKGPKITEAFKGVNMDVYSPQVKSWAMTLISHITNKINESMEDSKEYTVDEFMQEPLMKVNLNKAVEFFFEVNPEYKLQNSDNVELEKELKSRTRALKVEHIFPNEIEYADFYTVLEKYKNSLKVDALLTQKDAKDNETLKLKYKYKYFPSLNMINHRLELLTAQVTELCKEILEEQEVSDAELEKLVDARLGDYLTFVEFINITEKSYTCGSCGEENDSEMDFFEYNFIPDGSSGYTAVLLGGVNQCDNCGKFNVLSEEELKALYTGYSKNKSTLLRELGENLQLRRNNEFAFSKYFLGFDKVMELVPDRLAAQSENSEETVNIINLDNIKPAILRYKEMIKFFNSYSNNISDAVVANDTSEEIFTGLEPVLETIKEQKSFEVSELDKYTMLAKFISSTLNSDYNDNKRLAIDSILTYFNESKFGRFLKYSERVRYINLLKSRDIIDIVRHAPLSTAQEITYSCIAPLGVQVDLTQLKLESNNDCVQILSRGFKALELEYSEYENYRSIYLNDIKQNINYLGVLNISKNGVKEEVRLDYLQDSAVRELIDVISNKMIINSLSEEFFSTWFVKYKNNYNKINKYNGTSAEFGGEVMKCLSKFGFGKKHPLEQFHNIVWSLYPDKNTMPILEKCMKLKVEYDRDLFRTIIVITELAEESKFSRILSGLLTKVNSILPELKEVIDRYGTSGVSRLQYYFEEVFSKEEIERDYKLYMDNIVITVVLERKEGEDLVSYLERYKAINWSEETYRPIESVVGEKLRASYVYIDSLILLANSNLDASVMSNVNLYVATSTIINSLLKYFDGNAILEIMGYEPLIVNGLINSIEEVKFYDGPLEAYRNLWYISSFLFNSSDINEELSDAVSLEDKFAVLSKYEEELKDSKHLKELQSILRFVSPSELFQVKQ